MDDKDLEAKLEELAKSDPYLNKVGKALKTGVARIMARVELNRMINGQDRRITKITT